MNWWVWERLTGRHDFSSRFDVKPRETFRAAGRSLLAATIGVVVCAVAGALFFLLSLVIT